MDQAKSRTGSKVVSFVGIIFAVILVACITNTFWSVVSILFPSCIFCYYYYYCYLPKNCKRVVRRTRKPRKSQADPQSMGYDKRFNMRDNIETGPINITNNSPTEIQSLKDHIEDLRLQVSRYYAEIQHLQVNSGSNQKKIEEVQDLKNLTERELMVEKAKLKSAEDRLEEDRAEKEQMKKEIDEKDEKLFKEKLENEKLQMNLRHSESYTRQLEESRLVEAVRLQQLEESRRIQAQRLQQEAESRRLGAEHLQNAKAENAKLQEALNKKSDCIVN